MIMNKKGFTLVELIVVVAIIAILAAIAVPNFMGLIDKAEETVDEANAKIATQALSFGFLDGTLIVRNNKVFNTISNRAYSGTGSWFIADMGKYLGSAVSPLSNEAGSGNNLDGGTGKVKFLFKISGNEVVVFYNDPSGIDIEVDRVRYQ